MHTLKHIYCLSIGVKCLSWHCSSIGAISKSLFIVVNSVGSMITSVSTCINWWQIYPLIVLSVLGRIVILVDSAHFTIPILNLFLRNTFSRKFKILKAKYHGVLSLAVWRKRGPCTSWYYIMKWWSTFVPKSKGTCSLYMYLLSGIIWSKNLPDVFSRHISTSMYPEYGRFLPSAHSISTKFYDEFYVRVPWNCSQVQKNMSCILMEIRWIW